MIDIDTLSGSELDEPVYRAIPSRYPQINLFESVSSPQNWDVLYAVESLSNSRLRDEVGIFAWCGRKTGCTAMVCPGSWRLLPIRRSVAEVEDSIGIWYLLLRV